MVSSLNIIIEFVFHLACMLFLVRFLLQASQADFYNPISQAVVKGTDPLCKPLRAVLKPFANLDFASIFVAWLIGVINIAAVVYVTSGQLGGSIPIIMWMGLVKMLLVLTQFYKFTLFIVIIASFLAPGNVHPILQLLQQLLEPLLGPIRRIMPSLGPLDLSPLVFLLGIYLVENMIRQMIPGL